MSVYIPADLARRVRMRFANCCAYCRTAEALSVASFEIEHIVPRSAGGGTIYENVCLSCPMCNRWKSDRTMAADSVTQQDVPLFHPQRDTWSDHFAWNADSTALIGVTPTGRATIGLLRMNRAAMTRLRRMWVALGEHPPTLD